jgi:hypothetical protein
MGVLSNSTMANPATPSNVARSNHTAPVNLLPLNTALVKVAWANRQVRIRQFMSRKSTRVAPVRSRSISAQNVWAG